MAQGIVYGHREALDRRRNALSAAIHAAIMITLEYPPEKRFQRFVGLDDDDFIHPEDRGVDYTIIEISMFEGRSESAKRALITEIFRRVEADAGIAPHSLEITITETQRGNWGIRGRNGADLALGYRVGISSLVHRATGLVWPALLGGLLSAGTILAFGYIFDRVLRAELREP